MRENRSFFVSSSYQPFDWKPLKMLKLDGGAERIRTAE